MDLGLKDKNVVVTGGSKGIGYAAAKIFLQEGAKVTICARNKEELGRAVLELASWGKYRAVCWMAVQRLVWKSWLRWLPSRAMAL